MYQLRTSANLSCGKNVNAFPYLKANLERKIKPYCRKRRACTNIPDFSPFPILPQTRISRQDSWTGPPLQFLTLHFDLLLELVLDGSCLCSATPIQTQICICTLPDVSSHTGDVPRDAWGRDESDGRTVQTPPRQQMLWLTAQPPSHVPSLFCLLAGSLLFRNAKKSLTVKKNKHVHFQQHPMSTHQP